MSFPRYPKYKASGVDWLGDVPEHWNAERIRWFFEIKKRIAGELGHDVLSITQQGIKVKDLESNVGQLSMDYSKYQFVEAGDFAMNHMDLLTGYVDISNQRGVTSPDYRVFSIRDSSVCHDKYLLFFFQMGYKNKIFYAFGQGSSHFGRWRLPTEQFNNLRFPLPPIAEQTAIAEFLDRETGKIDGLVAEQRRLMELLKDKIASLVLSSVDLPSTKRLRFGDAASIISRPVFQQEEESYTRIGLFNRGRGLFHKDASEMDDMGESDFFWIEEGDLIISGQFAWEGAVAMAGKADTGCVVSHRYPVLRGVPEIALTEYLFGLLCTDHGDFLLNENSRGAAGRNRPLNIRYLMKETIPVPSMQIQEAVARAIHSRAVLFEEISNTIDLLQERRTALISSAVTGQIDVRQQARN